MLSWIAYATTAEMMLLRVPLPKWPILLCSRFALRIEYGLFAVMTRGALRNRIPGSDGRTELDCVSFSLQASGSE